MIRVLPILVWGDLLSAVFSHFVGLFLLLCLALYSGETLSISEGSPGIWGLKVAVFALVLVVVTYFAELYDSSSSFKRGRLPLRILSSLFISYLLLTALYHKLPQISLDRDVMLPALLVFGALQMCWHHYYASLLRLPGVAQKVLILGVGPLAKSIERTMTSFKHDYVLAGFVQPTGEAVAVRQSSVLASIDNLLETAVREGVGKIVISLSERRGVLPVADLLQARFNGIEVVDAARFHEELTGTLLVRDVAPGWFIYANGFGANPLMRICRRLIDVILAIIGLTLCAPMLPLLAMAIRFDSPGPVLFRQLRLGKDEKPFYLYKFRTMRQDAEQGTGAVWAQQDDPRVTRFGKFLRKSRLDEIPQLFNVLKGDMAFVGPRPERPEFVSRLKEEIPYYSKRHVLKPGVTGWAQVKYPYGASVEDSHQKLMFDLYYVKNHSFLFDVQIILETVKVVLFGRGSR